MYREFKKVGICDKYEGEEGKVHHMKVIECTEYNENLCNGAEVVKIVHGHSSHCN